MIFLIPLIAACFLLTFVALPAHLVGVAADRAEEAAARERAAHRRTAAAGRRVSRGRADR